MTDVVVEKESVSGLHTERLNGDWNWLFRKLALPPEGQRKSVKFADYKIWKVQTWGVVSVLWICTKEKSCCILDGPISHCKQNSITLFHKQHGLKHKERQHIYAVTQGHSYNHCCCGKVINIKYSECVSVALVIQHAKRMHYAILPTVTPLGIQYFSKLSHNWHNYWKKVVGHRMCTLKADSHIACHAPCRSPAMSCR